MDGNGFASLWCRCLLTLFWRFDHRLGRPRGLRSRCWCFEHTSAASEPKQSAFTSRHVVRKRADARPRRKRRRWRALQSDVTCSEKVIKMKNAFASQDVMKLRHRSTSHRYFRLRLLPQSAPLPGAFRARPAFATRARHHMKSLSPNVMANTGGAVVPGGWPGETGSGKSTHAGVFAHRGNGNIPARPAWVEVCELARRAGDDLEGLAERLASTPGTWCRERPHQNQARAGRNSRVPGCRFETFAITDGNNRTEAALLSGPTRNDASHLAPPH